MVETGDKVLVFTDGTGKYWLEESSTPEVGDKGLIVSKDNVNFFLSGTTPEIGDKCGVFEIDNKIFIQPLGGGILQYFDARLHYYIVDYYQWLAYASVTTKCLGCIPTEYEDGTYDGLPNYDGWNSEGQWDGYWWYAGWMGWFHISPFWNGGSPPTAISVGHWYSNSLKTLISNRIDPNNNVTIVSKHGPLTGNGDSAYVVIYSRNITDATMKPFLQIKRKETDTWEDADIVYPTSNANFKYNPSSTGTCFEPVESSEKLNSLICTRPSDGWVLRNWNFSLTFNLSQYRI